MSMGLTVNKTLKKEVEPGYTGSEPVALADPPHVLSMKLQTSLAMTKGFILENFIETNDQHSQSKIKFPFKKCVRFIRCRINQSVFLYFWNNLFLFFFI
jgi:hypothetical protein